MSIRTLVFALLWAAIGGITLGAATQAEYGLLLMAGAMYVVTLIDGCLEAIAKAMENRS